MKILKTLLLVSPFILGACDGYELVRTEAFPYGNQRTAGTGVAYVLAKMAPPKVELKLEPTPAPAPAPALAPAPVIEPEAINKIEETFNETQKK